MKMENSQEENGFGENKLTHGGVNLPGFDTISLSVWKPRAGQYLETIVNLPRAVICIKGWKVHRFWEIERNNPYINWKNLAEELIEKINDRKTDWLRIGELEIWKSHKRALESGQYRAVFSVGTNIEFGMEEPMAEIQLRGKLN